MTTTNTTIAGNFTATGNITATAFYGDGNNLTNLNGDNVNFTGTANQVAIYDGTGGLFHEAQLATSRGGTGADTSAATGLAYLTAGTWSYSNAPLMSIGTLGKMQTVSGQVHTTDATDTTIATFSYAPDGANTKSALTIALECVCGKEGDGAGAISTQHIFAEYSLTYNSAGPATVITQLRQLSSGTLPAYTVTLTNTGTTLNFQVTGAAATSVDWVLGAVVKKISFPN